MMKRLIRCVGALLLAGAGLLTAVRPAFADEALIGRLMKGFDLIVAHHENSRVTYGALASAAIQGVYGRDDLRTARAAQRAEASGSKRDEARQAIGEAIRIGGLPKTTEPLQAFILAAAKSAGGRNDYKPTGALGSTDPRPGSLGLEMTQRRGKAYVHRPLPKGPADEAGVRANDELISIAERAADGAEPATRLEGMPLEAVIAKLRGVAGSIAVLTVQRAGEPAARTIAVKRRPVFEQSVREGIIHESIGYLRITKFGIDAAQEVSDAMASIRRAAGAQFAGVIIDLRGNGGGLVDEAVKSADHFIDAGIITSLEGRNRADNRLLRATPGDLGSGKPIVLIVDGRTSDGAELFAAALARNGRAQVVGAKTRGQAAVTTVYQIEAPDALVIQTGRWQDPTGRSWEGSGLIPDIAAATDRPDNGADDAVDAAVKALRSPRP